MSTPFLHPLTFPFHATPAHRSDLQVPPFASFTGVLGEISTLSPIVYQPEIPIFSGEID